MAITYQNRLSERAVNNGAGGGSGDFTSSTFSTSADTLLVAVVTIDTQGIAVGGANVPTPVTSGTTWTVLTDASGIDPSANTAGCFVYVADSPGAGTGRTFGMNGASSDWDNWINSIDVLILEFTGAANAAAHVSGLAVVGDVSSLSSSGRDLEALSVTANSTPRGNSMMLTAFAADASDTAGATPGTDFTEIVDRNSGTLAAGPYLRTYVQIREGSSTSTEVGWVGGDLNSVDTSVIYDYWVSYLEIMAAPNIIATDNFNRANGGLGANWTAIVEAPSIVSNQAKGASAGVSYRAAWTTAIGDGATSIWVEADVVLNNGSVSYSGVLLSEANSNKNESYGVVLSTDGTEVYLTRTTGGSDLDIATVTDLTLTTGVAYKLRMEWLVGGTISVYVDGVEVINTTNTDVTPSYAGIQLYTGASAPLDTIDNFRAGDWTTPDPVTTPTPMFTTTGVSSGSPGDDPWTITRPYVETGDVMVLTVCANNNTLASTPSGWILADDAYEGAHALWVFYKRVTNGATEPATFQVDWTAANYGSWVCSTFRGCDPAIPAELSPAITTTSSAITNYNAPSANVRVPNSLKVVSCGVNSSTIAAWGIASGNTILGATTSVQVCAQGVDNTLEASAGTTGTTNFTFGESKSGASAHTLVLRPVPVVIATDDFNRANEALTASADWTLMPGSYTSPDINTNEVISPTVSVQHAAYWASGTFDDDQWVEADAREGTDFSQSRLYLRASTSVETHYYASLDTFGTGRWLFYKVVAGSGSTIASTTPGGLVNGSMVKYRFEVVGTVLTLYADGVEVLSFDDSSSPITTGRPGVGAYFAPGSGQTTPHLDNFRAGDWSTGSPPTTVTINPVESVSTSVSDTAQLTVTSPITDYVIEYRTTSGPGAWQSFSDGVSVLTGATVTGLTPGVSYDFRISAVNALGRGLWSNIATVTAGSTGTVNIKFGDNSVTALKLGDTAITKAYLGDTQILG